MEKLRYDQRPTEMHLAKVVVNVKEHMANLGDVCTCGWAKVYAKSPDRPEYDKRRDRIAARCMKYGNADRIRAWEGKLSKHGKKNAVKSPAGALYSELRLRDDIVERDRVALLKPLRQKQKFIDDAEAELRTVPQLTASEPRSHKKKRHRSLDAVSEPDVSDVSTDSSMRSVESTEKNSSEGMDSESDESD